MPVFFSSLSLTYFPLYLFLWTRNISAAISQMMRCLLGEFRGNGVFVCLCRCVTRGSCSTLEYTKLTGEQCVCAPTKAVPRKKQTYLIDKEQQQTKKNNSHNCLFFQMVKPV